MVCLHVSEQTPCALSNLTYSELSHKGLPIPLWPVQGIHFTTPGFRSDFQVVEASLESLSTILIDRKMKSISQWVSHTSYCVDLTDASSMSSACREATAKVLCALRRYHHGICRFVVGGVAYLCQLLIV